MNFLNLTILLVANFAEGIISTLSYAFLGIVVAVISYFIVDLIIPGKMGKQIGEDQNVAIAIVAGSTMLGICIIIAASIIG